MARHRSIRNTKSYDYEEDYDSYGRSYEDNYCVSPGTLQQYSYSHSIGRGAQFSSFFPSEETVTEEVCEGEESMHEKNYPIEATSPAVCHATDAADFSDKLNICMESIENVLGDNYTKMHMKNAALKHNFDSEQAIDFLLQSTPANVSVPFSSTSTDCVDVIHQNKPSVVKHTLVDGSIYDVSMPQSGNHWSRKKNQEQDKSAIVVTRRNSDHSVKVHQLSKPTKIETTSHTPVKTGFHIAGSPRSVVQQEMTSDNATNRPKKEHSSDKIKRELIPGSFKSNLSPLSKLKVTGNKESTGTPSTPGRQSKNAVDYQKEYVKRMAGNKQQISMVVIGHVDAGKSTMMGHILFQKGVVSQRVMHKYEQESRKQGKASFAYAWVLDETGEERARGVTMDVAHNHFETASRIVTLMDAPGHRDFIPNMITGASQADVAILVVGASTGEFEAGFGIGGQTREHALLVRSLGVSQLAVAVNKLDTVEWSKARFDEIVGKLKQFLKQAGYRDSDVSFVPVSGLLGENLASQAKNPMLCSWYQGPCMLEVIDKFRAPARPVEFALRFCINDVYRSQGSGIYVDGKIESGGVCPGTKVMVMPAGERGLVKWVETSEEQGRVDFALAGEHATLVLNGVDMMKVTSGSVICDADKPIRAITRLQARIIVFNIEVPITRGFPVELHYKAISEPAVIRRIHSQLHKSTGEVITKKPKVILKGQNALVEVEVARPICLEEYATLKELGRFTLRYGGSTIAACVVTQLL